MDLEVRRRETPPLSPARGEFRSNSAEIPRRRNPTSIGLWHPPAQPWQADAAIVLVGHPGSCDAIFVAACSARVVWKT